MSRREAGTGAASGWDDGPWGEPVSALSLQWAGTDAEASRGAPRRVERAKPPKAPRRIRYRVGGWRRARSLAELLVLGTVLAAVLAAILGGVIALLVVAFHHVGGS